MSKYEVFVQFLKKCCDSFLSVVQIRLEKSIFSHLRNSIVGIPVITYEVTRDVIALSTLLRRVRQRYGHYVVAKGDTSPDKERAIT